MEVTHLIGVLALVTLLGVTVFALRSKKKVEDLREDDSHEPSTLAKDG